MTRRTYVKITPTTDGSDNVLALSLAFMRNGALIVSKVVEMPTIVERDQMRADAEQWATIARVELIDCTTNDINSRLSYTKRAPADFEFEGMKVGAHEEPCGGPCIAIEMPKGQIVQVWSTSTHNGHPRIQVWETTENFENCQEPDHDLTTGSDE
jgi:hypothetical protein